MTKQTKMLLGVGALAVVGYFVYTKMKGTKANAIGSTMKPKKGKCKVYASAEPSTITERGKTYTAYPCSQPNGGYSTTAPSISDTISED
jgi:hypothetical protein